MISRTALTKISLPREKEERSTKRKTKETSDNRSCIIPEVAPDILTLFLLAIVLMRNPPFRALPMSPHRNQDAVLD